MKKHIKSALIVTTLAMLLSCGCSTTTSAQKTWEYRIIQGVPRQEEFQQKLNAAAAEGYAIHSSQFIPGDERTQHQMVLILKRRKP
jgi:hypothetical protein